MRRRCPLQHRAHGARREPHRHRHAQPCRDLAQLWRCVEFVRTAKGTLFPTLVATCFESETNTAILRGEMSTSLLEGYIREQARVISVFLAGVCPGVFRLLFTHPLCPRTPAPPPTHPLRVFIGCAYNYT